MDEKMIKKLVLISEFVEHRYNPYDVARAAKVLIDTSKLQHKIQTTEDADIHCNFTGLNHKKDQDVTDWSKMLQIYARRSELYKDEIDCINSIEAGEALFYSLPLSTTTFVERLAIKEAVTALCNQDIKRGTSRAQRLQWYHDSIVTDSVRIIIAQDMWQGGKGDANEKERQKRMEKSLCWRVQEHEIAMKMAQPAIIERNIIGCYDIVQAKDWLFMAAPGTREQLLALKRIFDLWPD